MRFGTSLWYALFPGLDSARNCAGQTQCIPQLWCRSCVLEVLRRYVAIALLRGTPANLPGNLESVVLAAVFGLASYALVGSLDGTLGNALQRGLIDLILSATLLYATLVLFARQPRFPQSLSALCGAGGIINLVALPLMWRLSELPQGVTPGAGFLLPWTLLIGWSIAVQAHVLRTALDCRMALALALAVGYLFIALAVFDLLF